MSDSWSYLYGSSGDAWERLIESPTGKTGQVVERINVVVEDELIIAVVGLELELSATISQDTVSAEISEDILCGAIDTDEFKGVNCEC